MRVVHFLGLTDISALCACNGFRGGGYHPIENRFIPIGDNVQFIAAVNRGNEFSGTYGIDVAQLDRFAPLQMDYMPPSEEIKLLHARHPELSKTIVSRIVNLATTVRNSPSVASGLSVRATDEACMYIKHPLFEAQQGHNLLEILKSSFCGRFAGRWDDVTTDAGAVWAILQGSSVHHNQSRNSLPRSNS